MGQLCKMCDSGKRSQVHNKCNHGHYHCTLNCLDQNGCVRLAVAIAKRVSQEHHSFDDASSSFANIACRANRDSRKSMPAESSSLRAFRTSSIDDDTDDDNSNRATSGGIDRRAPPREDDDDRRMPPTTIS